MERTYVLNFDLPKDGKYPNDDGMGAFEDGFDSIGAKAEEIKKAPPTTLKVTGNVTPETLLPAIRDGLAEDGKGILADVTWYPGETIDGERRTGAWWINATEYGEIH